MNHHIDNKERKQQIKFERLLNQLLHLLKMTKSVFETMTISSKSDTSRKSLTKITEHRQGLIDELITNMKKQNIKIDKRTNSSLQESLPYDDSDFNMLSNINELEMALLEKYVETNNHPDCPLPFSILIGDHIQLINIDFKNYNQ